MSSATATPSKTASFAAPFRHTAFTVIWTATVVSNVGGWMYSAASGWLMTGLNPDPLIVALVEAASSLPICLFAIPAGALADIFDKRKYLIVVESLYTGLAAVYAAMVALGLATPVNLLLFTLVLGAAGALTSPAWQAVVPQLVPKDDLSAAIAANSVGVNISRALGPALGGATISAFAIVAPFWLNAVSISALSARCCGGAKRAARARCCRRSVSARRCSPAFAMRGTIFPCAARSCAPLGFFCSPAPIGRCCRWSPAGRLPAGPIFTACSSASSAPARSAVRFSCHG